MVQNSAVRSRGRPRKFDESVVLEQARDVFWNFGYAATSLDELSSATGLNRPSLYAAFGDKHALYLRALDAHRADAVEGIRTLLNKDGRLPDVLYAFLTAAAASTLAGSRGARGCFIVCTAVTEALSDPETRAIAAQYVAEVDGVFRERFERSRGELARAIDPAHGALLASAMLQTLAVRARSGSGPDALEEVARAAVVAICGEPPVLTRAG